MSFGHFCPNKCTPRHCFISFFLQSLLDTPSRKYFLQFVHSQLTLPGAQSHPPPPGTQSHPPPPGAQSHPPPPGTQSHPPPPGAQSHSPPPGAQSHPLPPDTQLGLLDVFRHLHPAREGAYSWWHTVTDSRKVNYGKRIDLVLCSMSLGSCAEGSEVCQTTMGSDHCPVSATFSVTLGRSPRPPSLCSKYFTEFSGRQQTLSSLWASLPAKTTSPLKRSASGSHGDGSHGAPVAKVKRDSKSRAGRSIMSFFKSSAGEEEGEGEEGLGEPLKPSQEDDITQVDGYPFCEAPKPLSIEWKSVFSAPRQVLCSGHQEPCVLRTAKKQGPNYNRQFYCCARPGGFKGDSNARCSFFMWTTKHRKS